MQAVVENVVQYAKTVDRFGNVLEVRLEEIASLVCGMNWLLARLKSIVVESDLDHRSSTDFDFQTCCNVSAWL